jgi:hypothetical protein
MTVFKSETVIVMQFLSIWCSVDAQLSQGFTCECSNSRFEPHEYVLLFSSVTEELISGRQGRTRLRTSVSAGTVIFERNESKQTLV